MDAKTKKLRYPANWDEISRNLRRAVGHCQNCNTPGQRFNPLTVHHIDYNPMNCAKDNLVVLCAACHLRHQAYERTHPEVKEQLCLYVR